ncbi:MULTISPECIES: sodium-dependent transporter [unclassified Paenibacillus]|uniref:sodium-dependent transporter n=1 Tax=unclassified Paenibacillus TaxID=185978 RepID=UPI001AE2B76F|nr:MULTISPECIES: sodium-dependent transporter [unclassified Paenibacillus]MBP1153303.1 NSS family neurotransmitter:Na+ symporter [Paenibacillus sp. PvP091]MBP1171314.1 NSS family neurotransmitter:Na+ symporter [Paenibacillus sp. PvR098]MBP2442342.1 NSS family neurotransmitter:Na+ symporter [Paenibacillus sp. PvP052]
MRKIPASQSSPKAGVSERFTSTGFILAAIGSSVGLGNMWKFPYITGQYGGAAFFLLFIICLIVAGLPILLAELTIGRGGRGNASTSLFNLSGKKYWGILGLLPVITAFLVMCYYAVVVGWTLHYTVESFTGLLFQPGVDYKEKFVSFAGGYMPLFWQAVVMLLTGWILAKGISGGIEKFNKVLIPGFLIILLILMVRSLTLPGAGEGVSFFLKPDFTKLNAESALVAMGHAFFSLSLGFGCMLTYGSYVEKKQSLGAATLAVGFGDLIYAFIAGLVIFPTVFSYGLKPGEGVGLVFMALPAAFSQMPFGFFFGGLFFLLLAIAALTSAVSILEVPVAYVMHKWKLSRKKASVYTSILCFLVGIPSALSVAGILNPFQVGGKTIFDLFDFATSYVLMPLGGLIVTLFTGYAWKRAGEEAGLSGFWYKLWMFLLRVVCPVLIVLIFLYSVGLISLK